MPDANAMNQYRVLHVTEAAAGGVLQHLDFILPALQSRGIPSACFIFSARADAGRLAETMDRWKRIGIGTHWLPLPEHWLRKAGCWREIFREFGRLVREFRPDIVHFHSSQAGGIGRLMLPWLSRRLKAVYSPHAFYWHPEMPFFLKWSVKTAEQLLAFATDRFILVGSGERLQGRRMKLPWRRKVSLVPNGLPEDWGDRLLAREAARGILKIPPHEFAVVVPGRFAWQKGQVRLLEMLSEHRLPENCRIYFCGENVRNIPLLHPAAAGGPYVFLDHVKDLDRCYRAFDLGILPSRYEGLSYALLEMLAAGLPVLATDIPENQMLAARAGKENLRLSVWQEDSQFRTLLAQALKEEPSPGPGADVMRMFPLAEQLDGLCREYAALVLQKT